MRKIYKRNQTIEVTTPNNVKIEATVLGRVAHETQTHSYGKFTCDTYLCYAQNRLFTYNVDTEDDGTVEEYYGKTVCKYCVIPDIDDDNQTPTWTTTSTIS